jgi:hypothetical protein
VSALAWMVGTWSMLVSIVAPPPPEIPPVSDSGAAHEAQVVYTATVSAYSCDANPANAMHPCGPFRDGSVPHSRLHGIVAAGPYEWLGRVVFVDGFGSVEIRDTPRNAWIDGKPHIDLFLSFPDAVNWGIQSRKITVGER